MSVKSLKLSGWLWGMVCFWKFSSLCCQRPEPPSHAEGEFIFYLHVYICLARTEYVQMT